MTENINRNAFKPFIVKPEARSVYIADTGDEVNTNAQLPQEITYEADISKNPKNKNNYFGLVKLEEPAGNIIDRAFKYAKDNFNQKIDYAKDALEIDKTIARGLAGSTVDFLSTTGRFLLSSTKNMPKNPIQLDDNLNVNVVNPEEDERVNQYKTEIDKLNENIKAKTQKFMDYTGIAKTDKDGFIYDLASGGASLLYSMGLFAITKNPTLAASTFGGYQYQNLYEEAIGKGYSPEKASKIGIAGGVFEAGLEFAGLHLFVEALKVNKMFGKITKAALTEYVQEFSQQTAEEVLTSKVTDVRQETWGNILNNANYAGIIGAITGGGAGVVSNIFVRAEKTLIDNGMPADKAKELTATAKNEVLSPQSLQEVKNIVRGEISPVTYEKADPRESYRLSGQAIKKALNPETARGVEKEFLDSKAKFKDELIKLGQNPDNAEASAYMADRIARMRYNEEGTNPADFYNSLSVENKRFFETDPETIKKMNVQDLKDIYKTDDAQSQLIRYSDELGQKFGKTQKIFEIDSQKPALIYGGKKAQMWSNGQMLVLNKELSEKLNNNALKQAEQNRIYQLIEQGRTLKDAKEIAAEETKEYTEQALFPSVDKLIPDIEKYQPAEIKAVTWVDNEPMAVLKGEKGNSVYVPAEQIIGLKNKLSGSEIYIDTSDKNKAAVVVLKDNNGVQAIISPITSFKKQTYINLDKNEREFWQAAAMYKNKISNIADFVKYVYDNPTAKKSYYRFRTKNGIIFDIPSDTILHDTKHQNVIWQEVVDNIDNIQKAVITSKKGINQGIPILIKLKINNDVYGLVFENLNTGRNIINTIFKSTDKGVDAWIEKETAKTPAPLRLGQAFQESVQFGQSPYINIKDIINFVKRNNKEFYQDGNKTLLNKYLKKVTETEEFKKWFDGSKVVDENGKPIIIYKVNNKFSVNNEVAAQNFAENNIGNIEYNAKIKDYIKQIDTAEKKGNYELARELNYDMENYDQEQRSKMNANVTPVFVKIENPKIIKAEKNINIDKEIETAKKEKYDGIIIQNNVDKTGAYFDNFIAFKTENIKAVYNQGEFDVNNPNIYMQDGTIPRGRTRAFDGQYIIELFSESADPSTLMHELSHVYLLELERLSKLSSASAKTKDLKATIDDFLGEAVNGEYSVEQQELFASSFEAYLQNGEAPNVKLKTAFEKFKKWLSEIYDSVRNRLPKLDDKVKQVFDKILSDTNTVTDSGIYEGKEEAVKEVIAGIRRGQNLNIDGIGIQEVKNLLNIAYTRKPSSPAQTLEKLLKDNDITNLQELANFGEQKLYDLLVKNQYIDKTSADKTTQAVDLAKKALDKWNIYKITDNERIQNISNFDKNLKLLNKVVKLEEIDSLLSKIADIEGNNVTAADITEAEKETKDIDNTQDIKTLEKMKDRIKSLVESKEFSDSKLKAEILQDLDDAENTAEIKESVKDAVEDMKDEQDKQIKKELKSAITQKAAAKDATAAREEIMAEKHKLRRKIRRIVKLSTPRKSNQQKFSKFGDPEIERFFTDLRRINGLKIEDARKEYLEAVSLIDDPDGEGLSRIERLHNLFLSFKSDDITHASLQLYKELYKQLSELNIVGRNAKEIQEYLRKDEDEKNINELLANITKYGDGKITNVFKKAYIGLTGNWYSTINTLSGKEQADKDSIEIEEIRKFTKTFDKSKELREASKKILGLKNDNSELDLYINRLLNEKYDYLELNAKRGEQNSVTLNKMNILAAYIYMKNQITRERIVRAFGQGQINDMFSKLSTVEKQWGDAIQEITASMYNDINKIYIKMYGMDLMQREGYFPSHTERIQGNMDLLKDSISNVSSPSFVKQMVDSRLPLMKFGNPMATAFNHIAKVQHFINMQTKMAELMRKYKDIDVKRKIEEKYGKTAYQYILQLLDNSKFENVAKDIDAVSGIGDWLTNNFVLTRIAVKPSIMFKQLLSSINYSENIPAEKWVSLFIKGAVSPLETKKYMMDNSPYLKARYEKGAETEALTKALEGMDPKFAKIKTLKGALSFMTRVGDLGAIVYGGYPMVKYLQEQGMSKEEAFKQFELATTRSQQSGLKSQLSNFQARGMNSWIARGLFAFSNTPHQYVRKMADSIIMYSRGEMSKKDLGKTLFVYGFLNSFLYHSFTSLALFAGVLNGDWDEAGADILLSLFQVATLSGMPLLGEAYDAFVQSIISDRKFDLSSAAQVPTFGEISEAIRLYQKDELEFGDWVKIIDDLASLTVGIPVETLVNTAGGFNDVLNEDYGKGFARIYGMTERRAERTFNE